nr:nucleoside deaminase [uncultured Ruminococcus sp.]
MDERMMERALALAQEAFDDGEVPVGAVVVRKGEIVGEGRNRREKGKNALYHAELEAIDNACKRLGGWRLWECELYVTLEPCPMCAGAIVNARIPQVYFGAYDPKNGCCGSVADVLNLPLAFHPAYQGGVMQEKCSRILSDFFKRLR